MEIICVVTPMGLVPADESDYELLHKFKRNTLVKCSIKMSRNIRFHRKFFWMLQTIVHNIPWDVASREGITTVNSLKEWLLLKSGRFDIVTDGNGKEYIKLHSISFSSMDEVEFENFFSSCISIIQTKLIPSLTRDAIESEYNNHNKPKNN